jgi:hypothetical protein
MGYTDGAGRMVAGAVRYIDKWEVLWAASAFDTANDINSAQDVVGSIGVSAAIRPYLYIESKQQGFLLSDLIDPAATAASPDYGANGINDDGWVAGGASSAVLLVRTGDMPVPSPPDNLTAVPHEPTRTQPWNAITLAWENTSDFTRYYTIERTKSGAGSWTPIRTDWLNLQYNDTSGELGIVYDYRVLAQGIAGLSEPSSIATAQFPSEPVDRTAPMAVIVAPENGAQVSGNVPVVADFSDDGGLEYVELSVSPASGKSEICSQSPAGAREVTLSCTWRTKRIPLGSYTLHAYAYDTLGNWTRESATVELVADSGGGGGGGGKGKGGGKKQ